MHIVNSPLEQFEILPGSFSSLCPLHNNFSASLMIVFFFFLFFSTSLTSYKLVPTNWQALFEVLFSFFFYLSRKNERRQYITTKFNTFRITSKGNVLNINYGFTNSIFYKIFPLTFFSFMFLLFSNMGGMIPYSFTVTAHIIATASFSSILFFGMNFKEIRKQGRFFFSRFHPNTVSVKLAPYLIPIETISYFFRCISLPVRLFANMTAGHILLKIIVGFVWVLFISLSSSSSTIFTETIICLCCIVMVVFIIMEIIMAVLQAYVFATLLVIYNKDASTLAKY